MSSLALVSLRRTALITATFLLFPVAGLHDGADHALVVAAPTARIRHALAGLPLSFEPNLGQADPRVKFLSRGRGYTLFLTKDQAILAMQESGARSQESGEEGRPWSAARGPLLCDRNSKLETRKSAAHCAPNSNPESPLIVRLRLQGANSGAKVAGQDELPGKSNYFIGNDPKKWRTRVPTYGRVRFASIYPGVDLVYYGEQNGQLEYDFVLAPGADPKRISLAIAAEAELGGKLKALRIASNGDLVVHLPDSELRLRRPVVYQARSTVDSGESAVQSRQRTTDHGPRTAFNPDPGIQNRKLVDARYVLKPDGTVTFETGPYDRTLPLVIDPVLSYSTYLGGSDMDYANGIAVDHSGNAYVTGYTASVDFPVVNAVQSSPGGGSCLEDGAATPCFDAFVSELNSSGTALVYSTYLGGSDEDYGASIAVDLSGDAYVAGYTYSTNFPVQNALQPNNAGGVDAFVTELSAGGASLIYSTYWGGSLDDVGTGITVDSKGNAYLSGYTESTNFPVTSGAFQTTYGNGAHNGFVVKFNSGGTQVGYSTYLGGSGDDYAYAAAVDSAGDAYVTGATNSTNFPSLNAFQPNYAGGQCAVAPNTFPCYDAFVSKLNPAGSALLFSTYLGGTGSDYGYAIALDSSANAYITGYTTSINFPTTPAAFDHVFSGAYDVFVAKLNSSGSALAYSTYLGGSGGTQAAYGIAVDSNGSAYVTGYNYGGNFPTANPVQAQNTAFYDAFVSVLDPTGSFLVFSTYLGGTQDDFGRGIALDPSGNIYVAGATFSPDFPTTSGSFEPSYMGGPYDAFVTKYSAPAMPVVAISPSSYNFGSQAVGTASSPEAIDLTNTGGVALVISSITASGDFSQTNNCGAGLASGASCTISVTFTPSQSGARSGAITVSDNASPATQTISLTGTGAGAQANLAPSSLTFSPQPVGTSSSPQSLTLSNSGSTALTISSIAISGDFSQTNTCGSSLAANSSCTISVTFTPTAIGSRSGTITVTDNASPATQAASLSGTGTAPTASLSPTSLVFASQALGTSSSPQSVTLNNPGSATLTISSITVSGDFSQTNTCGTSLAAGSSCTISVTFTPTASGSRTGSVTVTDNASPATQTVSLSGTGTAPIASLSPTSLTFSSQALNTTSSPQSLTLSNTGTAALKITSIAVTGNFSQTNTCGSSVAAGASCSISATFKPTGSGQRTGTVTVTDNASPATQTASLTGTGAGPGATLSPVSLTFATQAGGTSGSAQTVTLKNTGTASLTISSITISGDFSQTHTCSTILAVGNSCSISVTFKPTASGTRTGVLTVSDNAVPATQTVSLTGTGAAPAVSLSPTSLTFASQAVGTSSSPQSVILTNTGSATLTVSGISASGDFSQTNTCGSSVAAGASCTISVTFKPTVAGTRNGTLTITDNASPSTQTVSLTGTGTGGPAVSLSPTSLTFASQAVGTSSSSQAVKLENTGTSTLTISSIAVSGPFSQTNTCGSSVAAGASCSIAVTFKPIASGTATGTLTVTDNASPPTQTVSLTGMGAGPAASLSPSSLTFPTQKVLTSSSPQTVSLTNTGNALLSISSIKASGAFSQTNTCGSSVPAGASCSIAVTCKPIATGITTGTLTVTDNATPATQTVSLTGTGAASTKVSLSPPSLTFSAQTVGTVSSAQSVTLTNTGGAALSIAGITASQEASQTNDCGSSVAVNASCTLSVTFNPAAGGTRTAAIAVTDTAEGSPQTIALTGTGEDFTIAAPSGSSTSATVSPGGAATYSLSAVALGGFNQKVAFACTGAPSGASCTVSPASTNFSSPASLTVSIVTAAASCLPPHNSIPPPPQPRPWLLWTMGLLASGSLAQAVRSRDARGERRRTATTAFAALVLVMLALAACGGGGATAPQPANSGTPAGTYSLTITGTCTSCSTALRHSVSLSLIVQL